MSIYTIEITETLQKQFDVQADSCFEAIDKIREMYNTDQIQLTSDDFVGVSFEEPVGCSIARQMLEI